MRVKNFAHRVSCACRLFPPCIETVVFECWRRQPMSIHSLEQMTNFFPSAHDTSRLSSKLDSHTAQWPLLPRKKCSNQKNVSTMCTRFYKLDSTVALQDIVSCAWQSFLVTLSHNNRFKFLTALLQLDGLSSHSATLSALATLVPSAFGLLKYLHSRHFCHGTRLIHVQL